MQCIEQFHLFPRLPLEIRRVIWSLACSEPRHIAVRAIPLGKIEGTIKAPYLPYKYQSDCPIPQTLATCQESRAEALRYYEPTFGVTYETLTFKYDAAPQVYINRGVDRVCVIDYTAFSSLELMAMGQMACTPCKDSKGHFVVGTEAIFLPLGSYGVMDTSSYDKTSAVESLQQPDDHNELISASLLKDVIISEFAGTQKSCTINLDIKSLPVQQESEMDKEFQQSTAQYERTGRWFYDRLNEHMRQRDNIAGEHKAVTITWDRKRIERTQWLQSLRSEIFVLW